MELKAASFLGENLIDLHISIATSSAAQHSLDCFIEQQTAKLRAYA